MGQRKKIPHVIRKHTYSPYNTKGSFDENEPQKPKGYLPDWFTKAKEAGNVVVVKETKKKKRKMVPVDEQ